MLVRFSSVKTGSIIMHGDVAVELIRLLGATGNVPGALSAQDLPAALQRLQQSLPVATSSGRREPQAKAADDDADQKRESLVDLRTRAAPLIELMQRAAEGEAAVMWEAL